MYDRTFGMSGPDDALIPALPPVASQGSFTLQKRTESLVMEMGFFDDRAAEREVSDAEFARAAGSVDDVMDEALFVETVTHNWGLDRKAACACFIAGDLDKTKRIDRHEYLLLRDAFVSTRPPDQEHAEVALLRLRAVLHKYDADRNGELSRAELLDWLRDLCTGTRHVERIAAALLGEKVMSEGDGEEGAEPPGIPSPPKPRRNTMSFRGYKAFAVDELACAPSQPPQRCPPSTLSLFDAQSHHALPVHARVAPSPATG
jgi:hypothetical protein